MYQDCEVCGVRMFLTLAALTGARRAQLLALRWRNISLAARRISFYAGWVEGPDWPVLAAVNCRISVRIRGLEPTKSPCAKARRQVY